MDEGDAKDLIAGFYAVYSVRSEAGGAHRASSRAAEVLERAEIDPDALAEGFESLALRAADSLDGLAEALEGLAPLEDQPAG
jgi:hypothetical protein